MPPPWMGRGPRGLTPNSVGISCASGRSMETPLN
jgi:hypothetical protein